jgi:hypothetical protein
MCFVYGLGILKKSTSLVEFERENTTDYGSSKEKGISNLSWVPREELGFWNLICFFVQLFLKVKSH